MYKISLSRVRDVVRVVEGGQKLTLRVDANPVRLVTRLAEAHAYFDDADLRSGDGLNDAAWHLAAAMFGDEQAQQLMDFYSGDGMAVIRLCRQYFAGRLKGLIERAEC